MRCSTYVNVGRTHARLNGELLEEVDCFKYLGSQVASDGGCGIQIERRVLLLLKPAAQAQVGNTKLFINCFRNPTRTCAAEN